MNKLKTYREYIILAAIAAGLLLYIIFRTAGNINYNLPEPSSVNADDINKVSIEGSNIDLEFSRTGSQWFIEPEGWHAENSNLTPIVKALADIKIIDLISTSGNPEVYDLGESQRVKVTAYNGDDILREIYVGKVSSTGIYTYMMLPGDDNIYSVRGNMASRISDKKSMRDKKFLQVNRDSIQTVILSHSEETTILNAEDEDLKSIINLFDPLRCKDFLYTETAGGPEWTLEITASDSESTLLEIWKKTGDVYPARSSQNGYMVNLTSYTAEKLLGAFGIEFEEN